MSVFSSCKNLPHESSQTDRNHRPINLRASMGVKGLHNSGNSCFMNSAIQCLANTFPLLEYILNDAYLKDVNYKYSGMHGLLMRTFVAVLKEMWSLQSRNRIIALSALKNEIGKIAPNFIGHSQQDAQEFLRLLLHGLRKEIIRPLNRLRPVIPINSDDEDQAEYAWFQYLMMNKSKVVDIFVGQLKSVLKCSTCGLRTVTFETFWDLSLPLPQKTRKVTLNQCLKLLTKKKKVKIICDRCMKQRKFCKTYSIVKLPKVLMIHLKRFHLYAPDRSSLHTSLNFPINGWNLKKFSNCHGPYIYNLYAVCYHQGEAHNGHYTACCKHPYTGERHKFDDAIVGKVSSEDLVNDEAYIFFYELQNFYRSM